MKKINWWRTDFRNGEVDLISDSIFKERIKRTNGKEI